MPGPLVGDQRVPRRGRASGRSPRPTDVHAGQPRLGDLLLRASAASPALTHAIPLELHAAMFIAQDPPKHDRLKTLFQSGFTPKRIAEHEDADPRDHRRRARPARRPRAVRPRHRRRPAGRLAGDRQLHGDRPEDDAIWAGLMNSTLGLGDETSTPAASTRSSRRTSPRSSSAAAQLIAERRENPTDDLTSVLVHAEIDGEKLEEHEIVMGFFLLMAAGNDSTKATYTQRHEGADGAPRADARCSSTTRR